MKNKCKLDGGGRVPYDAAFLLSSTAKVSIRLEYIGVGVIVEVGGEPYGCTQRLRFYRKRKFWEMRWD